MPLHPSKTARQSTDFSPSAATTAAETLFLLSISRDEDDAAALRSDLKRSSLGNYKIQRCIHLDDAIQLLQVCGFDLAFVRIDDFQDPQTAIDHLRQSDPELCIVGLVSHRLLNSSAFAMPQGVDSHCRLEDLSPTLVSTLVHSTLDRKRANIERLRLTQELNFAVHLGQLGAWTLDTETGRTTFSQSAAEQLGIANPEDYPLVDDLIELVYPADQDSFKRRINQAIEDQSDLEASVHLLSEGEPRPKLSISAKYRPGGPRDNPSLYGFIRRDQQESESIQERIVAANAAIQKALTLRDEAIAAASQELEALMLKVGLPQEPSTKIPAAQQETPATKPTPSIGESRVSEVVESLSRQDREIPEEAPAKPEARTFESIDSKPQNVLPTNAPETEDTLGIDKSQAMEKVLQSIQRTKEEAPESSFPFDFSTEDKSGYAEPSLQHEGFLGAAHRLVDITQSSHDLSITLSIEKDGSIESEREKDLIYDILRELLTNVVKHAHASECIIALFRDEDDWVLQVEDDGIGLESKLVSISTPLNKIGLFQIRTKLASKGGQLDLTPTFPKGLIARARLPVTLVKRDAEHA